MEGPAPKIRKLTRDSDYRSWAVDVRSLMTTQSGLHRLLDRAPEAGNGEEELLDDQAKAKILLHLDRGMKLVVATCASAHEMWEKLRAEYVSSLEGRRMMMMKSLHGLRQGRTQSVTAYCDVASELRLDLIDLEFNAEAIEAMIIPAFLAGINHLYSSCIPQLQDTASRGFERVAKRFRELALNMPSAPAGGGDLNTMEGARADKHKHKKVYKKKKDKPEKRACFLCGEVGHIKANCPHKEGHDGAGPAAVMMTMAGTSRVSKGLRAQERGLQADMIFDSGASHHVVHDAALLRNMRPSATPDVKLGGGERHAVLGEGELTVRSPDTGKVTIFKSVLYVPGLSCNLISGYQVAARGSTFKATSKGIFVHDTSGMLRMIAHQESGLFRLRCSVLLSGEIHVTAPAQLWHERLCHPSLATVKRMSDKQMLLGLPNLKDFKLPNHCKECVQSKQMQEKHLPSETRAKKPLGRVHSDLMKMPCKDHQQNQYVLTLTDDFSRYTEIALLNTKSEAASRVAGFVRRLERQTNRKLQYFRSDGGSEYFGLKRFFDENGITHEVSMPYTPQQNGRAERLNRTLVQRTRAILLKFALPDAFWGLAVRNVVECYNRTASVDQDKTPYELFFGSKPAVDHLRVFGCKAFVLKKPAGNKLSAVSEEGIFVGYPSNAKGWLILVERDGMYRIVMSCDVKFEESESSGLVSALKEDPDIEVSEPHHEKQPCIDVGDSSGPSLSEDTDDLLGVESQDEEDIPPQYVVPRDEPGLPASGGQSAVEEDVEDEESESGNHVSAQNDSEGELEAEGSLQDQEADAEADNDEEEVGQPVAVDAQQGRRTSGRATRKPDWFAPVIDSANIHSLTGEKMPMTLREAYQREDGQLWRDAYLREYQTLQEKEVFDVVHKDSVPADCKIVQTRIVATVKPNGDKKIRCVAKGFQQRPGMDFEEVSAPTVRSATVHAVLALTMNQKKAVRQIDVRAAFLNAFLREEVYVYPPTGHSQNKSEVWRLKKALYGLRQAAHAWYETWKQALLDMGFKISSADACLFYFDSLDEGRMFLALHVDDALLTGSCKLIDEAMKMISSVFEIKDEGYVRAGRINTFLGIELTISEGEGLILTQATYAKKILERFGMLQCKPKKAPLPSKVTFPADSKPLPSDNEFPAMIGALLYLAVHTRPDIAQPVAMLSRAVAKPTEAHREAAKHVLRYVAGDPEAGLLYPFVGPGRAERSKDMLMRVFSDADYSRDKENGKSTAGMLVQFGGRAISWSSKLMKTVTTSTCEAEYTAASEAVKEILWLRELMKDLTGRELPIRLYIDNQAALTLTEKDRPQMTNRCKHMAVRFHFVREWILKGFVQTMFVATDAQLADPFTKNLDAQKLHALMKHAGMRFTRAIGAKN